MNTDTLKKLGTALVAVQILSSGAFAVSLIDETLETDGNGTRYFANEFTGANPTDFNHRTNVVNGNETPSTGTADPSYLNSGYFWNTRDIDGSAPDGAFKDADRSMVRFISLDLSSFSFEKLTVSIDLALGSYHDKHEIGDFFDIQYSFDNALDPFASSEAALLADEANFTSLAKFVGDNQARDVGAYGTDSGGGVRLIGEGAAAGESMSAGNVHNGAGHNYNATLVEDIPFRSFSYDLNLTGLNPGSITFELISEFAGSNEVFAWDNFKVEGIEATTPPPSNVPDSSATGILLGSALFGLFACRRFKRS